MSQSFQLFRLQQIDTQLDQAKARLAEIEVLLSDDQVLQAAKQSLQETATTLETAQQALLKSEHEVQDQRVKIEQTESTLYSGKVRNPKELQDLQNEVAALKRFRSVLEDRQIEAMIAVEEAESTHAQMQASLAKVLGEFDSRNQALLAEKETLQKDVERLDGGRRAAASGIGEDDLRLYHQLRVQRRGVAVARVASDRACSACGSVLSAGLLSAARSPNQITRCSMCGRILYAL